MVKAPIRHNLLICSANVENIIINEAPRIAELLRNGDIVELKTPETNADEARAERANKTA